MKPRRTREPQRLTTYHNPCIGAAMTWIEIGLAVIGGLLTTLGIVLWFNYQRVLKAIDDLEEEMLATNKRIDEHKLYASETFARSPDVKESFDKLHICVDSMEKTCNGMAVMLATITEKLNHKI